MARYKGFKYGTSTHYGSTAITENGPLTWIFLVDWNNDGTYDGTNEAAWMKGYFLKRGRENYLKPDGKGFERFKSDTITLMMDDVTRRYDPRNGSSPLSPNVYPGKKCQIRVRDNSTGIQYTRFTGHIDSIFPISKNNQVKITCKGYLQYLADRELTTKTARVKTTIHDAFIALLDDAKYPGSISIEADTQSVIAFGVNKQSAAEVAGCLADSALGHFFIDKDGQATYYPRNHTYAAATAVDQSVCRKEIGESQPWDNVYNQVEIDCHKQIKEQPSVIFYLSNPVAIVTTAAKDTYPAYQPSSDISVSKILANTAENGSGTNITSSVKVSMNTLGPNGGQLSFTTTQNGYLTKCELRGRRWRDTIEKFEYEATARYNRRFILDVQYLQDRNYASSFCETLRTFLDDDRESLVIQIEGRPSYQFAFDILSKIAFTSAKLDLSAVNYWVLGLDEEWLNDNGQSVRTTFYLHKIAVDTSSITSASIQVDTPAPLGYDNPPGDVLTGNSPPGTGGSEFFVPQILYLTANNSPVWDSWVTNTITWQTEWIDSAGMISVPSTEIKIIESGYYALWLNGGIWCKFATGDDSATYGFDCAFAEYKNDVLINNLTYISGGARGTKQAGANHNAYASFGDMLGDEFSAGDILTIKIFLEYCSVPLTRSWKAQLLMIKLKEV